MHFGGRRFILVCAIWMAALAPAARCGAQTATDAGRLELVTRSNRAIELLNRNKAAEAEPALRQVLEDAQRLFPADDANVNMCRSNLAAALVAQQKFDQAQPLLREAIASQTRTIGPEHRDTLAMRNRLGVALLGGGNAAAAVAEFREVHALQERLFGASDPDAVLSGNNLAAARKSADESSDFWLNAMRLAVIAMAPLALGIPFALKLNAQLRARRRDARPFRWGYFLSASAAMAALLAVFAAMGTAFEPGPDPLWDWGLVAFLSLLGVCGLYGLLRKRWALVGVTLLTLNPIVWLANAIYLARRWGELRDDEGGRWFDLVNTAPPPVPTGPPPDGPPPDWKQRLIDVVSAPHVTEADPSTLGTHRLMRFLAVIGLIALLPVVFILPALLLPEDTHGSLVATVSLALGLAFGVVFVFVAQNLGMRAQKKQFGYFARQAVLNAKRPPVLYLRSFRFDEIASKIPLWQRVAGLFTYHMQPTTPEFTLARTIWRRAPVIAIGRPNEPEPPAGAGRFYVPEERWQSLVAQAAPLCSFVVWATGHTEGLRWELEHLIAHVPPRRLLLWPHVWVGEWAEESQQADWQRFLERFQAVFPKPLPQDVGPIRFITFDEDWTPRPLPHPGQQFTVWERMTWSPAVICLRDYLNERLPVKG